MDMERIMAIIDASYQTRARMEGALRDIDRRALNAMVQEQIAEQEYIVTNGRIEAALSEGTGAPLMRVSRDMGSAVTIVREAIGSYRYRLEELLHESSTRF